MCRKKPHLGTSYTKPKTGVGFKMVNSFIKSKKDSGSMGRGLVLGLAFFVLFSASVMAFSSEPVKTSSDKFSGFFLLDSPGNQNQTNNLIQGSSILSGPTHTPISPKPIRGSGHATVGTSSPGQVQGIGGWFFLAHLLYDRKHYNIATKKWGKDLVNPVCSIYHSSALACTN